MKRKRRIQLGAINSSPRVRQASWENYRELPNGYERRWRRGKTLHVLRVVDYKYANGRGRRRTTTRERLNAVIPWQCLLDAVKVIDDDATEPPWEDCDGWQHTITPYENDYLHPGLQYSQRYFKTDRRRFVLTVDPDQMGLPSWNYFHGLGASKQVARQLAAKALQEVLRQLRKWRSEGWNYYGVKCEFRHYEASCWRIDDYDYARDTVGVEMASEVASQLIDDGYLVTGRPTTRLYRGWSKEGWRKELKRRLNQFNME